MACVVTEECYLDREGENALSLMGAEGVIGEVLLVDHFHLVSHFLRREKGILRTHGRAARLGSMERASSGVMTRFVVRVSTRRRWLEARSA